MDPLTLASKQFRTNLLAIWEPLGAPPLDSSVLRVAYSHSDAKELVKTLRIQEWQPDNRRPFVIVSAPFRDEASFLGAFFAQLERDYGALRKGLGEEGVELPELSAPKQRPLAEELRARLTFIAKEVGSALGGLVLAIMPERIEDDAAYAKVARGLLSTNAPANTHLLLGDAEALRDVVPGLVTFAVDEPALRAYLKSLGQQPSAGPSASTSSLNPTEKAALEARIGRKLPSRNTATDLRGYLLDAAAALEKQDWKLAVKKFRAARMLCRVSGLVEEEACASIALGSAEFALGDRRAAIAAYRRGGELATQRGNVTLAAQAELGVAAVHFAAGEWEKARVAYRAVAGMTKDLPPLHVDAIRMEGEAFIAEGLWTHAETSFSEVLDIAESLPTDQREMTSFRFAGSSLVALYDRAGSRAKSTQARQRLLHWGVSLLGK